MRKSVFCFSMIDLKILAIGFFAFSLCATSPDLFAAEAFAEACENVNTFVTTLLTLLRVISVGVVTIAIIFAGYQIAFAHKRFTDIAPVLIGGLLIGGAAEIAKWFVGNTAAAGC